MALSNSYAPPNVGVCRCVALSSFDSDQYLVLGSYLDNFIYVYNGTLFSLNPTIGTTPVLFGSITYTLLGGLLPSQVSPGGMQFVTSANGGVNWTGTSYLGGNALELSISNGGIELYNSAYPSLSYNSSGSETFTAHVQVVDYTPTTLQIELYNATTSSWIGVYWGNNNFSTSYTNKGAVPTPIGSWITLTFTASDLGLSAGQSITGQSFEIYQSTGISTVIFSDLISNNGSSYPLPPNGGYIDACTDGASGFWLLEHYGNLLQGSINGTFSSYTLPTSSVAYTGITYNTTHAAPYVIGADGAIYQEVSYISGPPGGVTPPAWFLVTDNVDKLYTIFHNSNEIGIFNISTTSWSTEASNFNASLDYLCYGSSLVTGGSNYITINQPNIVGMSYASPQLQMLMSDTTANSIFVYTYVAGGWSLTQTISGTGNPSSISVSPNGINALITDTANNLLQVLTYIAGTWVSSTLSVTSPNYVTILPSGTQALVSNSTNNQVYVLNLAGSVWSISQTLSITSPTQIIDYNSGNNAAVISGSNVVLLNNTNAFWSVIGTYTASSPILYISDDIQTSDDSSIYAIYQNGGNYNLVQVGTNSSPTAVVTTQTITLSGSPTYLSVMNAQVFIPMNNNDLFVCSILGGLLTSSTINGIIPSTSANNVLAFVPNPVDFTNVLLIAGTSSIYELYNVAPYNFQRTMDSQVAVASGVSWTNIDLKNRNRVSSMIVDVSGDIFTSTLDNEIYKISGSTIVSGYPYLLIPPPGQAASAPFGVSKLAFYGGKLYMATSLYGGLISLTDS